MQPLELPIPVPRNGRAPELGIRNPKTVYRYPTEFPEQKPSVYGLRIRITDYRIRNTDDQMRELDIRLILLWDMLMFIMGHQHQTAVWPHLHPGNATVCDFQVYPHF